MTAAKLLSTAVLLRRLREVEVLRDRLDVEHAHLLAVLEARGEVPKRRRRREPQHGTDGGYYAHLRKWRTPACEPCLRAHAVATHRSTYRGLTWSEWRERLREHGTSTRRVRTWARQRGIDVAPSGTLPARVIAAYLDAHPSHLVPVAAA